MFKNLVTRTKMALVGASVSLVAAQNALAAPTSDDIWAAMDLSGIQDKVIPMAILCVGITLIGIVWALTTKGGKKAKGAL